jgi:hypothetical protein
VSKTQINILICLAAVLAISWLIALVVHPLYTLGYTVVGLIVGAIATALVVALVRLRTGLLRHFNPEVKAQYEAEKAAAAAAAKKRGW